MGKAKNKEAAWVLPEDVVASTEAHVFPDFPGQWTPGVPVCAVDMGRTPAEMQELVDAQGEGFPLKRTTAVPKGEISTVDAPSEAKELADAVPDAVPADEEANV